MALLAEVLSVGGFWIGDILTGAAAAATEDDSRVEVVVEVEVVGILGDTDEVSFEVCCRYN